MGGDLLHGVESRRRQRICGETNGNLQLQIATEANANVGGAVYKSAMGGNTDAQKFWLESRAGWKRWPVAAKSVNPPPFVVAREPNKE